MEEILSQIEKGLSLGQYYLSLFVALAIPDICGAIESSNGESSRKKYERWFKRYLSSEYKGFLDSTTCYLFRCSMLHQGSTNHPKSEFKRIIFIEPKKSSQTLHKNIINNILNIDVEIFCRDIVGGARQWVEDKKDSMEFIRNYPKVIKRCPNGISPYIKGVPVIG